MSPAYHDELMLLSATSRTVTFEVPPDADHVFLRALSSARAKGARYAAAMVLIGDDEEPVAQPTARPQGACDSERDRTIAHGRKSHRQASAAVSAVSAAGILGKCPAFSMMVGGDGAQAIRDFCRVESRAVLDDSALLAMRVSSLIDALGHWLDVMEQLCEGERIRKNGRG